MSLLVHFIFNKIAPNTTNSLEAKLKSPRTILIALIFLLVLPRAQETNVTISGFVTDATTGEALIGTNLLLYKDKVDTDNPPFRGTITNRYGFYAFPKISQGKYVLITRNIGYKTLAVELNVTVSEGTLQNNIRLVPEDVELEEIVIRGEREDEILISKIDVPTETLKQLPSLSGEVDIFKSLQMLPGIQVASELSTGLYIRGGSPDQTLTLVDGMILYNASHLGNFTSTFNSNASQDIRLIKGALPAEYGGRLSSVVDIKLRSGTREKESGSIGIGTVNSFINIEGPLQENSTFMIAGRIMYYDFLRKSFNEGSNTPLYNYYDLNGKFTYELSDSDILSVSAFLSKDNLYNPDGVKNLNYDINWQNGAVNLNWYQASENSYFTNTTISFVNYEFKSILNSNLDEVSTSDFFSHSKLTDIILKKNFDIYWHQNHTAKLGLEFTFHNYDLIASNFYDPRLELDSDIREKRSSQESALYLQNESQFGERLKTNIGLRAYYFSESRKPKFEPRVSFSYKLFEHFNFNGAYSLAHQFLHLFSREDKALPTDLWYPSTRNLEPSSSQQVVGGVEWTNNSGEYLVSLEGYYRDMQNLYEFKEDNDLELGQDIDEQLTKGEGEAYGAEFFINKRAGKLNGWVGYTLSWTRRLFENVNSNRIFYPRYDRRHDISLVLAYEVSDQLSLGMTWVYATGQGFTLPLGQFQFSTSFTGTKNDVFLDYTERNGYKLEAYHKLDLNLNYKFHLGSQASEFYINLHNVYNRANTFAQFVELEERTDSDGNKSFVPVMKKLTLFPFIPTAGLKINF